MTRSDWRSFLSGFSDGALIASPIAVLAITIIAATYAGWL